VLAAIVPRLCPRIVRLKPPDAGEFEVPNDVITGASYENAAIDVPTIDATVTKDFRSEPSPASPI
jgi:hypothetical protein